MFIAAVVSAVFLAPAVQATVLTFEVQEQDVWVGNGKNIPDSYGTDVTAADTPDGDYLQGNGWTPMIDVSYLPVRAVDPCTGEGIPDGTPDAPITVLNAGFNDGTSPVSGWFFASNEGGFAASIATSGGDYPGPNEGPRYLHISRNTWIYQKTAHPLTPGESYTLGIDLSDTPANVGWLGVTLYAGDNWAGANEAVQLDYFRVDAGDGPGEMTDTEWRRFSLTYDTAAPENASLVAANVGDPLWIRITAGPYLNPGDTEVFCDDFQLTIDGMAPQYAARTYQDGNWPAVAQLKWVSLDDATWNITFTPDPTAALAVDINSFELDPYDATGNESGNWSLAKDYGIVIDSGSWSNLAANQVVEVDMQPDGYYDGPVTLQLTITDGTSGNMAVDNIDFDLKPLDCDAVYEAGVEYLADVHRDCRVDRLDLNLMIANWLDSIDPPVGCETWGHSRGDVTNDCAIDGGDFAAMAPDWDGCNDLEYRDKKLVYFGWDFMPPGELATKLDTLQDRPFDGQVIFSNWAYTFWYVSEVGAGGHPVPGNLAGTIAQMEGIDNWGRFTDNFMYMVGGFRLDWFDDAVWAEALNNASALAQIAAAGGCKGVFFDAEFHWWGTPYSAWQYNVQEHAGTYSFEEYEAKIRQRGVEYIDAIEEHMPDVVFMTTFWSAMFQDRDYHTESDYYGLMNAFFSGVLEGANRTTRIIDGNERSYYYVNKEQYRWGHLMMTESLPGANNDALDIIPEELKSKYKEQVECGHAVYGSHPSSLDPVMLENRVFWSLDSSDGYVWFYCEDPIYYLDGVGVDPSWPPAIVSATDSINAGDGDGCPDPPPYVGPAAHWKMDETAGAVAFDTSPNGHDGALNNFPGDDSQWVAGQVDGALSFDGVNDYVIAPYVLDPAAGPFTACAWVKSNVADRKILTQVNGSGTGRVWLYTDALGNLNTYLGGAPMVSTFHVTDGQWHHVTLVWDGTRRYLYGDANNLLPDAFVTPEICDGGLHIGATKNATGVWAGQIDDVRIYEWALDPQEIADIYNAGW